MNDNNTMDTSESQFSNIDRFRLPNENDQQWFYRQQFIKTFQNEYNEERLLCLSQCYTNMKCLGCKYAEPLKSLLENLSERLSNALPQNSTTGASSTNDPKKDLTINQSSYQVDPTMTGTSNFVSFSSSNFISAPESSEKSTSNSTSILYETAETKSARLQSFIDRLRQAVEASQHRSGHENTDRVIEDIYEVGTQERVFIDYRPEAPMDGPSSKKGCSGGLFSQTFYGKLYIDEIYICSGHGTSKKICKRFCFQQAMNRLLSENIDVKCTVTKDGRQQYELITKPNATITSECHPSSPMIVNDVQNSLEKKEVNFVPARDTTTIAARTAKQQDQLERQYWQRYGRGIPMLNTVRRPQRSFSPPPPIRHQQSDPFASAVFEGASTTAASVTAIIDQMEKAAQQHQDNKVADTSTNPLLKNSEQKTEEINSQVFMQQRAKLFRIQDFLFSLSNTLADPTSAIDIISTNINKFQLNVEFQCADEPTPSGFHGHLIVEKIMLADGFGITKKLAKKQTYFQALEAISSARSFSLMDCDGIRLNLICLKDESGILKVPAPRRPVTLRENDRPSRWGPPVALSAITRSTTSAVRHLYDRNMDEALQKEQQQLSSSGVCIPPPIVIDSPLTYPVSSKDKNCINSSTDDLILRNIRRLLPNTFVLFESLDFDEKIPGHYVSMLFTSMSKNKLDLKYHFTLVPSGSMVTFTIDDRFFMSWVAPTKVAAKQEGARKAIDMLKTIYPSIKIKNTVGDTSALENETIGIKRYFVTRPQLYEQPLSSMSTRGTSSVPTQKEDVGLKLLKKMGWTGGGIGKDLQGIAEPIQIEDLQGRKGLGSTNCYPDQIFVRNLRRILEDFISRNEDDGELNFSNEFNSEERKVIHREAMRLHLLSNSYGRDGDRRIRITQKRSVDQLVDHLLMNGGITSRYELRSNAYVEPPSKMVKSRAYGQIAPPEFQTSAPDACDDGNL